MTLTSARLRDVLSYDPLTGIFLWIISHSRRDRAGMVAGCQRQNKYVLIRVDGRLYLAHRLAWLYITGNFPKNQIDHINGDPSDNRWSNLREASQTQNNANRMLCHNAAGFKGVHFHKQTGRWRACIHKNREYIHIGLFDSKEDAHLAYVAAALKYFGEYARAK